nr:uncharacterized protein LOC111413931 [Onthophagus taurus]
MSTKCGKTELFRNFCDFLDLRQLNHVLNCDNRLLDLVLTNTDHQFDLVHDDCPFVYEDQYHPALDITMNLLTANDGLPNFPSLGGRYNFRRANFPGMYDKLLYTDWSFLNVEVNADDALRAFYKKLYEILDLFVPKRLSRGSSYPIWYTPEIKRLLKLKEYYRRKWRRSNSAFYSAEYKRLRCLTKQKISDAYTSFTISAEQSLSSDPRNFWNYIRQKTTTSRLPGKMMRDKSTYTDPEKIVNAFADQFSGVYSGVSAYNMVDNRLFTR